MNKTKFVLLSVVMLDILGIGLMFPALPELASYYDVNFFLIMLGLSIFSFFTFLAAPLFGQFSDKFGRKRPLLISVFGSAVSWFVIAISSNYWIFLIARAINGITGGNMTILQAIVTDISPDSTQRKTNLGILGGLFGMGLIIGPIIGSSLIQIDLMAPFWFAAGFSVINIILVYVFLPETNDQITPNKKIKYNPLYTVYHGLKKIQIRHFLLGFMFITLGFVLFQSTFALYLDKHYGIGGDISGYYLALIGLAILGNQLFLLKNFWLKYFRTRQLILYLTLACVILFLTIFLINNFVYFMILLIIEAMMLTTIRPVLQGEILDRSPTNIKGETNGIITSLHLISLMIGSSLGGYLLQQDIPVFLFSSFLGFIGFLFLLRAR